MAGNSIFGNCKYTPEEHAAIHAALKKKLGPSFISQRQCPGNQRLAYIEGWRIINLANEVFGFNGWSHSITRECTDFVDNLEGRFYVGVSAHVKIMLKDGAFHEDVGYGSSEGMRSKALALEKAKKEAVTDGLKRAFKSFGNTLGNCLSDKNYLAQIGRAPKPPPSNLNMKELKHNIDEDEVQRARYNSIGRENAGYAAAGGARTAPYEPRTPGKQFTKPEATGLQRRKCLDGSFQPRPYDSTPAGTGQRAVNGAGDGGHSRSNTHSGLSAAERERLERKQRQLQKQQEFREKMRVCAPQAPQRLPQAQNGIATRTPGSGQKLKRDIPLATSTQNPGANGRVRTGDLTAAENFEDTCMWDDSQLDHLMSENPNKVEAIIEQAQQPSDYYQTSAQAAPPSVRQPGLLAPPDGQMTNQEPMSPNTRGRTTRSTAKSPFRRAPGANGPGWKGRAPLNGRIDDNKRRKTDT